MARYVSGPIIAAGASLSSALDIVKDGEGLRRITFPAEWTSAAWLTFQFSLDGGNFHELYWPEGHPVVVTIVPDATVFLRHDIWRLGFFKFRSGSRDNPIVQPQQRVFQCALW